MRMLVVVLALASVIAPGLRHTQVDLVLWVMYFCEVVRERGLNEITQLGHLAIAQDEVVRARDVTHIGTRILAHDEVHLSIGQVSTKLEERHRRRE